MLRTPRTGWKLALAVALLLLLPAAASHAAITGAGAGGRIFFKSGFAPFAAPPGFVQTSAGNDPFPPAPGFLFLGWTHFSPAGFAQGFTAVQVGVDLLGFPQALVPIDSFLRQSRVSCAPGSDQPAEITLHFDAVYFTDAGGLPAHVQFLTYPFFGNNGFGAGSFSRYTARMTYGTRAGNGQPINTFGSSVVAGGLNGPGFFFQQPLARFGIPAIPGGHQFLMWGDLTFQFRGCPFQGFQQIVEQLGAEPLVLAGAIPAAPRGADPLPALASMTGAVQPVPEQPIEDPENIFIEMDPMPVIPWDENGTAFAQQIDGDGIPELDPPGHWIAQEGFELQIPLSVSDPEGDPLQLVLAADAPAGAAVDPEGFVTWTPPAAGMTRFHVRAETTANPSVYDEEAVTVAVEGPTNGAPSLDPYPDLEIFEGEPFSDWLTAFDPDFDDTLTFTLVSAAPAGLTLSADGQLSWTPGEEQGPSLHTLTVRVADDGQPQLWQEHSFYLSVAEENEPPALDPVADPAPVAVGSELTLTLTASDPDLAPSFNGDTLAQPLGFSLVEGPAGMAVDFATGELTWTPSAGQEGQHFVTVRVEDSEGDYDETFFTAEATGGGSLRQIVAE